MDISTIVSWLQLIVWVGGLLFALIKYWRRGAMTTTTAFPKLVYGLLLLGLVISLTSLYFNYKPRIVEKTVTVEEPYKYKWKSLTPDQLTVVTHKKFVNEKVLLDGYRYEDCTFQNVTFVFQGTAVPAFEHNEVSGRFVLNTDNNAVFATGELMKGLGMLKPGVPILIGPQYTEVPIEPLEPRKKIK